MSDNNTKNIITGGGEAKGLNVRSTEIVCRTIKSMRSLQHS